MAKTLRKIAPMREQRGIASNATRGARERHLDRVLDWRRPDYDPVRADRLLAQRLKRGEP